MLLVNFSREKIVLQGKGFVEELPYVDIERKLPLLLVDTIKKHAIKKVWVINGPGSFTTLRLGCLTVNTIVRFWDTAQMTKSPPAPTPPQPPFLKGGETQGGSTFGIYECSKLDIYRYAVEKGLLPSLGLIFIGQKKNMWKVEKTTDYGLQTLDEWVQRNDWKYEIVNQENISSLVWQEYFIDACEHVVVDHLEKERMVEWGFDGEKLILSYQQTLDSWLQITEKKELVIVPDELGLELVKQLEPRYMMEPQIG